MIELTIPTWIAVLIIALLWVTAALEIAKLIVDWRLRAAKRRAKRLAGYTDA